MRIQVVILTLCICLLSCNKDDYSAPQIQVDYGIKFEGDYMCLGKFTYLSGLISGDTLTTMIDTNIIVRLEKLSGLGDTLFRFHLPEDFIASVDTKGNFVSYCCGMGHFVNDSIYYTYFISMHDGYRQWDLKGKKAK